MAQSLLVKAILTHPYDALCPVDAALPAIYIPIRNDITIFSCTDQNLTNINSQSLQSTEINV